MSTKIYRVCFYYSDNSEFEDYTVEDDLGVFQSLSLALYFLKKSLENPSSKIGSYACDDEWITEGLDEKEMEIHFKHARWSDTFDVWIQEEEVLSSKEEIDKLFELIKGGTNEEVFNNDRR